MVATITLDYVERVEGREVIKSWGQIECLNGDRVESYEVGVKTIQMLGVKQVNRKDYLVSARVFNKGQFDNYAIWDIYRINEDGTIEQVPEYPPMYVEFGFECVGE